MFFHFHTVALVAGLATGIPVIFLVFVYVTYCCCRRKQKNELLQQEPRLWRRDARTRSSAHDLFIPAYVPRFVQKFVQNSSKNTSETSSTQTSPVDEKTFFSEGSDPYRTAPDDMGGPGDQEWTGGLAELQVPEVRRSSLLQPSTSSGDSSESTYEHTPKKGIGPRSPRSASVSASDSKSFEFVRPIPVKPLITITRAESLTKDDLNARMESTRYTTDHDEARRTHSDSQVTYKKQREPRESLGRRSEQVSQAERSRSRSTSYQVPQQRSDASQAAHPGHSAKIPVNISSQVIRSRSGSKGKGIPPGKINLGRINISLQYKQTTCDLFVKVRLDVL